MLPDFDRLLEPFHANDIEWRVQSAGKNSNGVWAKVLAYVTNRAIMQRLDEAVGPANWRNEFAPAPCGGVMCGISIRIDGEWVTKWDGAENTDIEAVKGGLSGAMKRAAVQWGIGRYLYNLEEGWAQIGPNGAHYGRLKQEDGGTPFRWDPPVLPVWALPNGESLPKPSNATPANRPDAAPPAPTPTPSPTGAVPSCPKCHGAMWDNRENKRNPRAPDFKCKDKGCDGAIWPEKKKAERQPAAVVTEPSYDDFQAPFPEDDDLPF